MPLAFMYWLLFEIKFSSYSENSRALHEPLENQMVAGEFRSHRRLLVFRLTKGS